MTVGYAGTQTMGPMRKRDETARRCGYRNWAHLIDATINAHREEVALITGYTGNTIYVWRARLMDADHPFGAPSPAEECVSGAVCFACSEPAVRKAANIDLCAAHFDSLPAHAMR